MGHFNICLHYSSMGTQLKPPYLAPNTTHWRLQPRFRPLSFHFCFRKNVCFDTLDDRQVLALHMVQDTNERIPIKNVKSLGQLLKKLNNGLKNLIKNAKNLKIQNKEQTGSCKSFIEATQEISLSQVNYSNPQEREGQKC